MKTLSKLLLIPTLLIGLALPSQAQNMQTTQPSPVKLGVKGGLNFSNFNGDALDADYMTRGNVGLFLKYDVNPYFAIQCVAVKIRSEEHTSELQSRFDLVCRLLLEK